MAVPQTSFEGKTAVITGGGSGIGLALGARAASAGAHVVLADVDGAAAERRRGRRSRRPRPQRLGRPVRPSMSVTPTRCRRCRRRASCSSHGQLDLLFNNAGISMGGPTHELTARTGIGSSTSTSEVSSTGWWRRTPGWSSRVTGTSSTPRSGAGLAAPPFVVPYATTKHAVVGLSTGLRPEAALHGVRVSVLCPGAVETAILDRPPPAGSPPTASAPVTAREYLQAVRQRPISADVFARRALADVARNRSIIVVPRTAKALWYLRGSHRPQWTRSVGSWRRRSNATSSTEDGTSFSRPSSVAVGLELLEQRDVVPVAANRADLVAFELRHGDRPAGGSGGPSARRRPNGPVESYA